MREHSKRAQLFTWLKIKKFDITFLQETHCKSYSDSKLWEKEWGGSCFWSFGGSRSRGTCIMFREGLPFTKQMFYYDAVGRLVVVDASVYGSCYRLINVYAPNNHAERIQWFNELHRWFIGDKILILGGDFNCVENKSIDKIGGNDAYGDVGGSILSSFQNNYRLVDAYRVSHPRDIATTWASADGSVACRLDRFYVSSSLKSSLSACITPSALSDHSAVELSLTGKNHTSKGPSYWKCNVKILDDSDFVADLEYLCTDCMQAEIKDGEWWENCKYRFKRLIILHACRLAQNYRSKLTNLETELRELQLQAVGNSGYNMEQIKIVKEKISDVLRDKFDGAKIRSRAKYLDTEETPSSYFLRREKQNAAKSTINKLLIGGKVTRETSSIVEACRHFYAELYSAEAVDADVMQQFLNFIDRLPSSVLETCDGKITVEECAAAISSMENNKTPGSDGLPKEFYSKFFHLFAQGFVEMLNQSFEAGSLPPSLHGLITLACKDVHCESKNKTPNSCLTLTSPNIY